MIGLEDGLAAGCADCPAGYYCEDQLAKPCPASTFNPSTGSRSESECQRCPTASGSDAAAARLQDCTCALGFFDQTNGGEVSCEACPTPGSECTANGLTLATLPLSLGHWRWSNASTDLRRCEFEDECVGGTFAPGSYTQYVNNVNSQPDGVTIEVLGYAADALACLAMARPQRPLAPIIVHDSYHNVCVVHNQMPTTSFSSNGWRSTYTSTCHVVANMLTPASG